MSGGLISFDISCLQRLITHKHTQPITYSAAARHLDADNCRAEGHIDSDVA